MDEATAAGLAKRVGPDGSELFDRYRSLHPEWSPTDVAVAVTSDRFRIGSLEQAERHVAAGEAAYVYLFTWESPMDGGRIKAGHSVEVALVFDNVHRDASVQRDEKVQLVADTMSDSWLRVRPEWRSQPCWDAYLADLRHRTAPDDDLRPPEQGRGRSLGEERMAWGGLKLVPGL